MKVKYLFLSSKKIFPRFVIHFGEKIFPLNAKKTIKEKVISMKKSFMFCCYRDYSKQQKST